MAAPGAGVAGEAADRGDAVTDPSPDVLDLTPAPTRAELTRQRAKLIDGLKAEGLMRPTRRTPVPVSHNEREILRLRDTAGFPARVCPTGPLPTSARPVVQQIWCPRWALEVLALYYGRGVKEITPAVALLVRDEELRAAALSVARLQDKLTARALVRVAVKERTPEAPVLPQKGAKRGDKRPATRNPTRARSAPP